MRYRRAAQTAWRTIADETVVLDLEDKRMFGLNPAAAFVWQTLEAMEDPASLRRAMGSPDFGTDAIEAFLRELLALGLVLPEAPEERHPVALEAPEEPEPPRILWQEKVEQIAATCAFLPAQNPLCNQVPMS